jgi:hypothetical protein
MEYSPRTRILIEKVLKANKVPRLFWGQGFKKGAELAEPYAKKKGHHFIKDDDVIDALKDLTPPEKREELLDGLEKAGLDTGKLFPDW